MKLYYIKIYGKTLFYLDENEAKQAFIKGTGNEKTTYLMTDNFTPVHEIEFNNSFSLLHFGFVDVKSDIDEI